MAKRSLLTSSALGWAPGKGGRGAGNTCGLRPLPCWPRSGAAPHPLSSRRAGLCRLAPHTLWLRPHKYCSLRHSTVVGQGRKSHHQETRVCRAFSRRRNSCWVEPALPSGCWALLWGRNPAGGSIGVPSRSPHPHTH